MCPNCNIEMTTSHNQGIIFCEQCGISDEAVLETKKSSYKDPPSEVSYYAYQRKNHFLEILAQFQAKETANIPETLFADLLTEIKKDRISNLAKLKYKNIRKYLQKCGYSKYYEHIPFILSKLTGQSAPQFSPDVERKLILMFDMTQSPWDKLCPNTRDNFLNYKYTLYKFVELLGLDEYKKYLHLLKNRERLQGQDRIWKSICEDIQTEYPEWKDKWIFIPSI